MIKLILTILQTGENRKYKSLRDINKDYPQYTYSQLRAIYLQSEGQICRRQHILNTQLFAQIRINDDNIFIQNPNVQMVL